MHKTNMKTSRRSYESSVENKNKNDDDELFSNEQIQRYDADTIRNRYGENWRDYASNVREVKQADGSIIREYIIEDPSLLKEVQSTTTITDSTSSTTSSDDEQQSLKYRFAQIKAKFEQKSLTQVMASPSSSSLTSNRTSTTRRSSTRTNDDVSQRSRRESIESLSNTRVNNIPPPPTISKGSSYRRLNSGDEADEEVQRIHQQRETATPLSTISERQQQTSNIQYEIVDEDGNPMAIDGVQDLIKMSGVTAREVPQPDGTIVREYVIDDPEVLSKFQSQQTPQPSQDFIPPPPPRVPLKQSNFIRQEPLPSSSERQQQMPAINIQQIRTLEPQRRYEFVTSTGKRIEFVITNIDSTQADVHELANAVNTHMTTSNPIPQQLFTLPKQWNPAVDLTQREARTPSGNPPNPNDRVRSASQSQGAYSSDQFEPIFAEPIIDWSAIQQQDPHGQIDPQLIRQFITQKHQSGAYQTSAQFLPEQQPPQPARPASQSSRSNEPVFYPYQGQQQHGVQILAHNPQQYNYNQQQIPSGHTRI